ncbi:MAG: hypothetical protein HC764_24540 [Pleurocapsa sp. CRU_1_2]|nr:hypothetical protein [Pleurocapsa sp. CRU_1_2]
MLKPRDILVLLKVKIFKNRWTYQELAESLGISSSEVHGSLKNCDESGLYVSRSRRVLNSALHEFLVHGIRYSFPAKPGALVLGIPTAHSAEPLKGLFMANEDNPYVWSSGNGQIRGQAIEPLHKCVPQAVQKDPELYQLLSLVDGLRVGRAREQDFAAQELGKIMAR